MKITNIIPLFIAIAIVSCKQSPPKAIYDGPDTVAYIYREYKVRDNACGNNPDTACTVVKLNYPDFNGKKKVLTDSITRKFIQLFGLKQIPPGNSLQLVLSIAIQVLKRPAQNRRHIFCWMGKLKY
jgi:hypothetical protein